MKLNWRGAFYEGAKTGKEWSKAREVAEIEQQKQEALEKLRAKHNMQREKASDLMARERQGEQNEFTLSLDQQRMQQREKEADTAYVRERQTSLLDTTIRQDEAQRQRDFLRTQKGEDRQWQATQTESQNERDDRIRWEDRYNEIVDGLSDNYKAVARNYKTLSDELQTLRSDPTVAKDDPRFAEVEGQLKPLRKQLSKVPDGAEAMQALAKMRGAPEDFDYGLEEEGGEEGGEGEGIDPNKPSPITGKVEPPKSDAVLAKEAEAARRKQNAGTTKRVESSAKALEDAKERVEYNVSQMSKVVEAQEASQDPRATKRYKARMKREMSGRVAGPIIDRTISAHEKNPFAFTDDQIAIVNEYIRLYNEYNEGVYEPLPFSNDPNE